MKSEADQYEIPELRTLIREMEQHAASPEVQLREQQIHDELKAIFFKRWVPAAFVTEALAFAASYVLGVWTGFYGVSLLVVIGLSIVWPRR